MRRFKILFLLAVSIVWFGKTGSIQPIKTLAQIENNPSSPSAGNNLFIPVIISNSSGSFAPPADPQPPADPAPPADPTPPPDSQPPQDFHYGVLEMSGNVAGSATFESYINDWQSRGFDTALVSNDIPDLSVSDRLNFKIIASPLFDLYREWFYFEDNNNGAPLCGGNITIDCARKIIAPIVDPVKVHPSVEGYYTIDDAPPSLKERIRLATQVFKERDVENPASPGMMQLGEGQTVYEHARPEAYATYFYPAWNGYPTCNFYTDQYRDWVDRTRETIQERPMSVPFWAILQTHGSATESPLRTPTVEEVRLLNWLALGEDAKGIFWFMWSTEPGEFWIGLKDNPALLAEVTDLARRVNTLRPYLSVIRKISDKFQATSAGNTYISTLKDFSTGKLYVIAANHSCTSFNLTLSSLYYNARLKDLETGTIYNLGTLINFRGGDGKLFEVIDAVPLPSPTPQPNLVQNASFETDADNDGLPDGWGSASASVVRDTSVRHSGSASIKVTGASASVVYQDVTLKPNTKYYVSWYLKGQSLVESHMGMQYLQMIPSEIYLDSVLWEQNGSYDWVKRVGFFKTPSDYQDGRLIIGWDANSGSTYWVDDITFCEAGKPCADGYLKERE